MMARDSLRRFQSSTPIFLEFCHKRSHPIHSQALKEHQPLPSLTPPPPSQNKSRFLPTNTQINTRYNLDYLSRIPPPSILNHNSFTIIYNKSVLAGLQFYQILMLVDILFLITFMLAIFTQLPKIFIVDFQFYRFLYFLIFGIHILLNDTTIHC